MTTKYLCLFAMRPPIDLQIPRSRLSLGRSVMKMKLTKVYNVPENGVRVRFNERCGLRARQRPASASSLPCAGRSWRMGFLPF